jgi:hypothetical protein
MDHDLGGEALGDHPRTELHRLFQLSLAEIVDLVEDEKEFRRMRPNSLQKLQLGLADRLICGQQEDGGIGLRQVVNGGSRVARED